MSDRERIIDEKYQEYLTEKLNLIFDEELGTQTQNKIKLMIPYEIVSDLCEGFATVKDGNKCNCINSNGKLISDEWYDEIWTFHEGFAKVKNGNKYNFINTEGKIIFDEWYEDAEEFYGGFAIVKKNDKYNFINAEGKFISDEWYDSVKKFQEGFAIVKKNGKYNFIDTEGNFMLFEWYEDAEEFHDGLAIVKKNGKFNFINTEGKLISDEWYHRVEPFHEGFAIVEKSYCEHNFINTEGKLISDEWYYRVEPFHEGFAIVERSYCEHNFINTKGKLMLEKWSSFTVRNLGEGCVEFGGQNDKWYIFNQKGKMLRKQYYYFEKFHNGFAKVYSRSTYRYNFINTEFKLISNKWFDHIEEFHEGFAIVKVNGKYNYINAKGKLISDEWYEDAKEFHEGFAIIKVNGKYNVIDSNGNLIFTVFRDNIRRFGDWFITGKKINGKYEALFLSKKKDYYAKITTIDEYRVKKKYKGYKCISANGSFNLKYKPIKKYGFRYVLCFDEDNINETVYIYDIINNNYIEICALENLDYDDNFIVDGGKQKVYFVYENKFLDITSYYNKHLATKKEIHIVKGINEVYSKEEFSLLNLIEMEKIIDEEKRKHDKLKEEERKKQEIKEKEEKRKQEEQRLKEIARQHEEEERKKEQQITDYLKQLREILIYLSKNPIDDIPRIKIDTIFISVDDHLEINPNCLGLLKYIDLSCERFVNVKLENIDFSDCNLCMAFNPQMVYRKSLRNCNFSRVYISPFANFTDVDIRGCSFSVDNNPLTDDDVSSPMFDGAIYDETTTYNGIPLPKYLEQERKKKNS